MKRIIKVLATLSVAVITLSSMALSTSAAGTSIKIDATNFPDSSFRDYLTKLEKNTYITKGFNSNGYFDANEIALVKELSVPSACANIQGVEYFTSLESIDLSMCFNISSADFSANTKLKTIDAFSSGITSINVLNCSELETLNLQATKLSKLTVLYCPKLKSLNTYGTELDYLDLRKCPSLVSVVNTGSKSSTSDSITYEASGNASLITDSSTSIYTNKIPVSSEYIQAIQKANGNDWDLDGDSYLSDAEIDAITFIELYSWRYDDVEGIEAFTNITYLKISSSNTTTVDLSANKKLNTVMLYDTPVSDLTLPINGELGYLYFVKRCDINLKELSGVENVKALSICGKNSSDIDLSKFTSLSRLSLSDCSISGIDFSAFTSLEELNLNDCNISSIDFSKATNLHRLEIDNCTISNLDVKPISRLLNLSVTNCSLNSLDVSSNKYLAVLDVSDNNLTSIDVSSNENLSSFNCDGNNISELNLSKNPHITYLKCSNNNISSLDVSVLPSLWLLDCSYNKLTSLDLSKNTKLNDLLCEVNQLTSINVTNMPELNYLDIRDNKITSIDLSKNPELMGLNVSDNQIGTLDVSNMQYLYSLSCSNCGLSALDISNCKYLERLDCAENKITSLDISNCKFNCYYWEQTDKYTVGSDDSIYGCNKIFIKGTEFKYIYYIFAVDSFVNVTPAMSGFPAPNRTNPYATSTTPNTPANPGSSVTPAPSTTPNTPANPGSSVTPAPSTTPNTPVNPGSSVTPAPSTPVVDGFAERLYTKCLGRASDPSGKTYWINQLKGGKSGADVAKEFFCSAEFIGFNLDDKEYVTRLYRTFMDREPDQAGLDFWLTKLREGNSRDYVFYGFVNSSEWANICLQYGIVSGGTAKPTITKTPTAETTAFATRLYTTCLGRAADQGGLDFWASELANIRKSGTQVAYEFFFSSEFTNKNLSDEEFVNRLYATFMDRAADTDGFDYWINQLKTTDRKTVLYSFAGCPEFANICAQAGIIR